MVFFFNFLQELPPEVLAEKQAQIRKLQQQLRNEEMALVLLKKIRQSQLLADQTAKQSAAAAAAAAAGSNHVNSSSKQYGRQNSYGSSGQPNSHYPKSSQAQQHQQQAGKSHHGMNSVGGSKGSVSSREKDQYARQLAAQLSQGGKATADVLKQVNLVIITLLLLV